MEAYRIVINGIAYAKAILISPEEPHIEFLPVSLFEVEEAGMWEKDRAEIYCKMLNEEKTYADKGMKFWTEKVVV